MSGSLIAQIAPALESEDAEEQRILAGVAALLGNLLGAKRAANDAARADLAAILHPRMARPQSQEELDASFREPQYRN